MKVWMSGLVPLSTLLVTVASLEFSRERMNYYRSKVKSMFYHAYNGYLTHAYPKDELMPITCSGMNTWGSFSLTLVDALDTLLIMGNYSEFERASQLVIESIDVNANVNVSVFETNIRVVAGLLSAHMLSINVPGIELEEGWPCTGRLLGLAERVAERLLPAFNTDTGMPFGTVNLRHGVHRRETPITCTAGVGTFLLEFASLSRLTGNGHFERIAMKALDALWKSRSVLGLVGNHIDVQTGVWTATDAGIGAGVDSYFEYLAKSALLFQKPRLMQQFNAYASAINKWIRKDDWFLWVTMNKGQVTLPIFQSLEAFWPGILTLLGDVDSARRIMLSYQQILKQYGFPPEFYNIPNQEAVHKRTGYPLRPEIAESLMYLYRATEDPQFLQLGANLIDAIEHSCKTKCGYATIANVKDHTIEDRMESFFLAETTKYLYLLFDSTNFIHNNGESGRLIETPAGRCLVQAGGYVFNTEAHPIDPGVVYCCSGHRHNDSALLNDFEHSLDFLQILRLQPSSSSFLPHQTDLPKDIQELDRNDGMGGGARYLILTEENNSSDQMKPRTATAVTGSGGAEASEQIERRPHNSLEKNESEQLKARIESIVERQSDVSVEAETVKMKEEEEEGKKGLVEALDKLLTDWALLLSTSTNMDRFVSSPSDKDEEEKAMGREHFCPCPDCCRPLEGARGSRSLHSLLNAIYGRHIYPGQGLTCWKGGPVCLSYQQPNEYLKTYRLLEEDDILYAGGETAVDSIRLGSFKYRTLSRLHYTLLTSATPSFQSRMTGMGQVLLGPHSADH